MRHFDVAKVSNEGEKQKQSKSMGGSQKRPSQSTESSEHECIVWEGSQKNKNYEVGERPGGDTGKITHESMV